MIVDLGFLIEVRFVAETALLVSQLLLFPNLHGLTFEQLRVGWARTRIRSRVT